MGISREDLIMATKKERELSLAQKLGSLRKKKNISLAALAEKTGIPAGHLEKIEEGLDFAPVGDILKISRALTVDPGELLEKGPPSASDKELEQRRVQDFKKREDAYQYEVLTPDARNSHLRAFRVTIPPRAEHPKINYHHEGEELVHVLKGAVDITVGRTEHHLEKDQTLHFNSGQKHSLKNPGNTPTLLLVVVYTP